MLMDIEQAAGQHFERPAKRMRSESSSPSEHGSAVVSPGERDPDFYLSSGDCVLRVQNTLFRVHRFLLERDSCVFAAVFDLPQGQLDVEGATDAKPIRLEGDEVEDFRALLKYMYAPALDTQVKHVALTELPNIVHVSQLAHKYQMSKWQQWTDLVLLELVHNHSAVLTDDDMVAVYCAAHLNSFQHVLEAVTSSWLEQIRGKRLRIGPALDAGETYRARSFLGALYEIALSRMPSSPTNLFTPINLSIPDISPVHLGRIYTGYSSLSLSWLGLRHRAARIDVSRALCTLSYHENTCQTRFARDWVAAAVAVEKDYPNVCDIRERLTKMRQILDPPFAAHSSAPTACVFVSRAPKDPFVKLLNAVSGPEGLVAHFFAAEPAEADGL
ncbi:unnamed protein product [Mycena citricolor]|uniref:BTB domain-containing protein n=1 Tax=Mycena citricolor TaxID=2018698 RepID=A0AAD2HN46_9AGAR|nr:unnamed protein product [Mycena citricolor]